MLSSRSLRIASLALTLGASTLALSQTTYWTTPTSGAWSTGPWSSFVPGHYTQTAVIDAVGGPYTVTQDFDFELGLLILDSPDATLAGGGFTVWNANHSFRRGNLSGFQFFLDWTWGNKFDVAAPVTGDLTVRGSGDVSGTIGSGLTLTGEAGLRISDALTNQGMLFFTNTASAPLVGISGGTFVNEGLIRFVPGSSGGEAFIQKSRVENRSTIQTETRLLWDQISYVGTGDVVGSGQVVAAFSALDLQSGHLGADTLAYGSVIDFAEAATGRITLSGIWGNAFKGTIGSNMEVVLDAGWDHELTGDLLNKGTLSLTNLGVTPASTGLKYYKITNEGTLNFLPGVGGASHGFRTDLVNKGVVNVETDVFTAGAKIENEGLLVLNGDLSNWATVWSSGTLQGTGHLLAHLQNSGIIDPGNSIGTLQIGSLTNTAASTLMFEIGDGAADKLIVDGTLVLDGGLSVVELPTFSASVGDRFRVIDAPTGNVVGSFSSFSNPNWLVTVQQGFGGYVEIEYAPVPEPASMVALGLGALAALRRWRG